MSTQTSFWKKPSTFIALGVVVGFLGLGYLFWVWVVERREVPAGHSLVITSKWGKALPEGDIIAPGDEYKGIRLEPLKEGRHFLNPVIWGWEIVPMVEVPAGQCLVVTRLFGKEIPEARFDTGDFLAKGEIDDPEGERGILAKVLRPGKYRLNPHAFHWKTENAVEIGANEVGVRIRKVGKDPSELKDPDGRIPYVVPQGYRGVQENPVSNGTYYINPFVESIVAVQTKAHHVQFEDISFPTTDGFIIKPKVDVTYRVLPNEAPRLLVLLTDKGQLPQGDTTEAEKAENQILQKVVLPQIRGYVRIQGSKFLARQYISNEDSKDDPAGGNARERLQQEVMDHVVPECKKVGVEILSITLGEPADPGTVRSAADEDFLKLKDVIRDREQARIDKEQIEEDIKQTETLKARSAKEALKEQNAQVGDANREMEVATIKAQERLEVTKKEWQQKLDNAQIRLEAAKEEAKAILAQAEADADVIQKENEAEVAGLKRAVEGFSSPDSYAQYQVLMKVAPALTEIFASDDSDFAKLFSRYMTSAAPSPPSPPAAPGMPPAGEK